MFGRPVPKKFNKSFETLLDHWQEIDDVQTPKTVMPKRGKKPKIYRDLINLNEKSGMQDDKIIGSASPIDDITYGAAWLCESGPKQIRPSISPKKLRTVMIMDEISVSTIMQRLKIDKRQAGRYFHGVELAFTVMNKEAPDDVSHDVSR